MINKRKNKKLLITDVQPLRTREDIEAVKNYLRKGRFGERDLMIFLVGINTGLRCSDIVQLRLGTVVHDKTPYIYEQKTGKKRQVNLKNIARELDNYIHNQSFTSMDDYLFPSRKHNVSEHITVNGFYKVIRRVEFQMGRHDLGTHTMRKTFGYHFYKKTNSIAMVMQVLNHSNPAITKRYIGISDEEVNNQLSDFIL
ncbi:tyrosine-type recombinase/integrase [Apilactobacillus xinyiensis]|uniref:tyrosine-type recombinase/integrase n=1 Tax=Apilactobacillus xinyiensis TaxID=2841032 RepID=UPI00200F8600|nr:tyrosine-type recombinase/integrase [Apilactobacillus xinyiensis]MCL0319343.1 tyrosine-type recombinase/integrase [Apilactobacillus xinyiensis]